MRVNVRMIIFVLVVLAVGAIFVIPYMDPGAENGEKFATTAEPAVKLDQAREKGRPVFLEFYSAT